MPSGTNLLVALWCFIPLTSRVENGRGLRFERTAIRRLFGCTATSGTIEASRPLKVTELPSQVGYLKMLLNRLQLGTHGRGRFALPIRMEMMTVAAAAVSQDLHWIPQENREEVAHILDLARRAADRWDVTMSDFLSPAVAADAMSCLQGRSDLVAVSWGGYAQAERCR